MSPLPAVYDLAYYHGDTNTQTFTFKQGDGTPVDLTGATVACWVADKTGAVVVQLDVTVDPDPTTGTVTVTLTPGPPGPPNPPAGHYRYDLEITDNTGAVTTWLQGRFDVTKDITNG
jgi:hypothetical protein